MSFKSILVHVDPSTACDERIRLTIYLAHRFKAEVTGVFVLPSLEMVAPPESGAAAVVVATWLAELEEAAAKTGQQFLARLRSEDIDGAWHMDHGPAVPHITRRGRITDLVVLGQHDPDNPTVLTAPEEVIMGCGRPVMMVPYAGRFNHVGEQAIIAWNGSRECTRAIHDAFPLLVPNKTIDIRAINPDADDTALHDELVQQFALHERDAKFHADVTKDLSPAGLVLSHVADSGGDLVVMGAYGHSRLREMVLGGMTRDMLRSMTVPVLMAH
jgi:nucleotide-binding universal stress UspA family protein